MKNLIASTLLIILLLGSFVPAQRVPQLGKDDLKRVIAAMTVEEKAKLLVGMGMNVPIPGLPPLDPEDVATPEKVLGAAGRTHAIKRFGIPSLTLADGPAGVRIDPKRKGDGKTYFATAFPVATLLASSWDPALVTEVGSAFGEEVKDFGIDILLAPGMNIQRNPLGGRNFEYYSEDPLVSGEMAAAFVNGVQSKGVGTSIKHFVANNQEFNRMQSNSIVSERALRELYLRSFEIAVRKSQPWTVMSSYNLLNGTYTSQSRELLTKILRDEWGFKGFVMTDWFSGDDAAAQVGAGNDVIMPGNPAQTKAIIEAVKSGKLDEKELDKSVARVLKIVLASPTFKGTLYSSAPDLKAHAKLARRAGSEGMVLLKNESGALPLQSETKIALYGNAAYETITGGTGSGDVNEAYTVSVYQGLSQAGFALDPMRKNEYEKHIAAEKSKQRPTLPFLPKPPVPEMAVSDGMAKSDAAASDLAVFVLGRNSGEFEDRKVMDDFELTDTESQALSSIWNEFQAKGKKVVVVLNIGGPIQIVGWESYADAILLAWQPGQEAGHSIADVLSGKVNPSGRLAVSFPGVYGDVPSVKTFPGKLLPAAKSRINNPFAGKPADAAYEEGVFVGYRYYSTFDVEPAYEFGYGLSYTTFESSGLSVKGDPVKGVLDIRVTVKNTGEVPGRDVVQVYVGGHGGPKRELKAFTKTRLLKPGESEQLRFELTAEDLASFYTKDSAWIATKGSYTISAGGTSEGGGLSGSFDLGQDIMVRKTGRLLVPQQELLEMAPNVKAAVQD